MLWHNFCYTVLLYKIIAVFVTFVMTIPKFGCEFLTYEGIHIPLEKLSDLLSSTWFLINIVWPIFDVMALLCSVKSLLNDCIWFIVLNVTFSNILAISRGPVLVITNTAWVRAWLCKLQKRCNRHAAASDQVYQLLAHGQWYSDFFNH
jgi:hypothetical protein